MTIIRRISARYMKNTAEENRGRLYLALSILFLSFKRITGRPFLWRNFALSGIIRRKSALREGESMISMRRLKEREKKTCRFREVNFLMI